MQDVSRALPLRRGTDDVAETERLGEEIAKQLEAGPPVLAMSGDLGSGKTALVRGICRLFGCSEQVSSPSFTIINEYRGSRTVYHCDLYRIRHEEELFEAGVADLLRGDDIVLVEWAERARSLLPLPRVEAVARHGRTDSQRVFEFVLCTENGTSILHNPGELLEPGV